MTLTLRHGLLAVAAISVGGAAAELAAERHWQSLEQLVPWATLGVLVLALAVCAFGRSPRGAAVVRTLAVVVLLAALFGVYEHVSVNLASGPLDQRYADTWDTLGPLTQWWYALSKTVGPTPPLAPGMLAQSALLLVLATFASPQRPGVPERSRTRASA
ncbi:hypothetical protein [Nonomuraea rhodomycinica]|uniref:Uncharacterized protein n=1 Tax=Nonomuraea rhodomycinica TaxID=1712872 RepID=A0A7Y6IIQ5_9ACTN|nr:hypothetical protein [Nonomuraea rhodomycinica]NUW38736.1 hypothetical protein [Nonomuraea rhodomycinica]